jgi:hypothetical protein
MSREEDSSASTGGMDGIASSNEEEEEQRPRNEGCEKRQRTASPCGGGRNMVSLDTMLEKMNTSMSSAIASAVGSSGLALSTALGELREVHTAKMKAKDEEVLRIEMARRKLDDDLAVMRQLKVVVYFIRSVCMLMHFFDRRRTTPRT